MIRISRPAVDHRITPVFGVTRDGQPLSYNRAPAPDLAGWIARLSVTKLELLPGHTLSCGLFADTAGLRIQPCGDFTVDTLDGSFDHGRSALFCGPQTRLMRIHLRGCFTSVGVTLRPSAFTALFGPLAPQCVDKVVSTMGLKPEYLLSLLDPDASAEDWLQALEQMFREHIADLGPAEPEPVTARFEEIAFLDPAMSIAQAAREIGVDRRRLERLVVRDFGMPPKQVLKRARALDMASHLRGVADGDEAEAMTLRYYDESHIIREFAELFGMSPRQFTVQPQPLLTLTLEVRQARRLEMIKRLAPGAKRPWE